MADDRDNLQGSIGQPHAVGHASPPPPAPLSAGESAAQQQTASPTRGPRTLILRRSENGFGFTLRHFIVYPPESCCMLAGHERTKIDEPMDTIFVKQVHPNSPAAEAGLRTGDRVVSVDGTPTRGEQYASVVHRIQQAGPWLRLLVVSKEDDILQRYFGETAHNPETNQRPRLRSPERLSQKQRRSISMIPGPSSRTRQSWVCSLPNPETTTSNAIPYRHREDALYNDQQHNQQGNYGLMTPSMSSAVSTLQTLPSSNQRRPLQETSMHYDLPDDKQRKLSLPQTQQQQQPRETNAIAYTRSSADSRYDIYDRTRPESIYSRPSSERIYDRIKDPIYERVRLEEQQQQQQQQLPPLRYPVSRAEPQVPIYRPGRRITARRASDGSNGNGAANENESGAYGSIEALRTNDPGSRLSIESRRDSSPASKESSLSSFDSNSTLTGNECSDDSVIMNRLRKSFEQKEEFLRRPSHPIGWFLPEENNVASRSTQGDASSTTSSTVIQREFYARPQKLQRPIWPPNVEQQRQQRQQSPTRRATPERSSVKVVGSTKHVLGPRAKSNGDTAENTIAVEFASPRREVEQAEERCSSVEQEKNDEANVRGDDRVRTVSYKDDYSNYHATASKQSNEQSRLGNKAAAFVATLSRIHENVASSIANSQQRVTEKDACELSSSSSPGPDKKNEKFPVPPQGLQIVSRRAKQFESGRLFSDDDEEPTGDRTNLYKSELSRLSNKRSVPNVAVRKREFESKSESQEQRKIPPANRESKSLDAAGKGLSGNRIIPIGCKYIHCEPPIAYKEVKEIPVMEAEPVRLRARSNSAESWEATNGPPRRSARHTWQTEEEDFEEKENHEVTDKVKRQDSYLHAVRTQLVPTNGASNNGVVLRRQKNTQISDEDRATRRVSYLKATWGERMHVDSDLELSDSEPVHVLRSNSIASTTNSCAGASKDVEPIEREGTLHVKFTVLDGKRSTDRSWKQIWGVLRGPILSFYKDRHSQSPSTTSDCESAAQNVDVRSSSVDVAEDYTKRKHVLRVANPNTELLLQTEDATSMALWLRALHKHAAAEKPSDAVSTTSKQQAVPQAPGPMTPSATAVPGPGQRLSPLPSHKGIKKLTSFRNRSPTGQSPVNKTRKPSQTIEPLPSPKSKTWKGRVAKQFRKMHGQAGSPLSPTTQLPPEGATFKVPLELCPQSSFSEFVPLIVEMCTSIVEARGLEVVGIYRVPGNTAAISQLTDSVNKGFENINLQDPRWSDVNVISSLLKSFFRQLPDSLLTADLYPMFIDADKIEDPQRRMATIRKLLRDLPEHHFETLKFLMFHLKRIVEHSEVNKMEAKNLAIVFGPTLVRASGSRDNMVTMVNDMSHQCRIVESLLNNVDWFFSEEDLDDLSRLSVNLSLPADGEVEPTSSTNHSLLLNNIHKVEGMREMVSAKDIVSSIISAANRKIQRRRKGQDETDIEEHEDEKKSKDEADSLPTIRQSMALNERQCSVSEIVLMHESKNQSNHCADRIDRPLQSYGSGNGNTINGASFSRTKYANPSIQQPSVSSTSDSIRLSSETASNSQDSASTLSSASNETKQSNDEIAIRTYAGLSATTQERIRRFEQETKAMLQRDQHRQRREAEKREEEKRRIEMEWQLAKREMENDDLLDSIVDNTVTPSFLSERLASYNEKLGDKSIAELSERHTRSRSTTRITPLSIAVQQQPTARQKAEATSQLTGILGEKINNSVIKKFKTEKEPLLDSICLPPVRYGSLDSLHEVHSISNSSPSPSQQHRGIPGDISDDGSDLLTSLTTTFDRKWRSLVNPLSQSVQSATETSIVNRNEGQQEQHRTEDASQMGYSAMEVYRDPSLHKSPVDKRQEFLRSKNDPPEKDTDSTVAEDSKDTDLTTPDNDRDIGKKKFEGTTEMNGILDAADKDESKRINGTTDAANAATKHLELPIQCQDDVTSSSGQLRRTETEGDANETTQRNYGTDLSYTNKLEKFETLASSVARSRLKRSESLNKRSESTSSKLKRSESLNKHSERLASPPNGKLKRSESLNKHSDRSESPSCRLKRSESLTKTEKTECNISKRRQSVRKESATKLKRKNGMPERSIKRRHTVGGTKDFDKVHWLDNKLQSEAERVIKADAKPKKSQLRTSSPDLSTNRVNVSDTSFLIEVSFRGPSNVVFNVTNARPQSLPDANLASKVFKVPLESHV